MIYLEKNTSRIPLIRWTQLLLLIWTGKESDEREIIGYSGLVKSFKSYNKRWLSGITSCRPFTQLFNRTIIRPTKPNYTMVSIAKLIYKIQ